MHYFAEMKTYAIQTHGCQMNYSDSERVSAVLEQCGFSRVEENQCADLQIVNTCSVRQKSEDKAYGFMVQKKRDCPRTLIAVTGCMVRQTGDSSNSKDALLRSDPIDLVFRIEDVARLPKLLESHFPDHDFSLFFQGPDLGCLKSGPNIEENYFLINPKVENLVQVLVPITQGCDKFCTYCIVPYTRGRESSRPIDEIFAECAKHVQNGAKEITLLGQNVNSYTDGGEKCFAKLLLKIDELHSKGLSRLRFTSAHPQDFTDDVIDALASMKTACPYIHLPVQHGSNRVLRAMNRNYTVEQYEEIIARIRKEIPTCTLSTDIIVGFPGETEEEFQVLCDFAKRMKFDFSYTAIFSPRKNTPASRMEKEFIGGEEKKRRFHDFDDIIKKASWEKREQSIGTILQVLVEKAEELPTGKYQNTGRSREFFEVYFPAEQNLVGQEMDVEIVSRQGYVLYGKVVDNE